MFKRKTPFTKHIPPSVFAVLMGIIHTQRCLERLESVEQSDKRSSGMVVVLRSRLCEMYAQAKSRGIKCNIWQRRFVESVVVDLEDEERSLRNVK